MKNTQTKSQKIATCITRAKEAHLTVQTDQPSPGTDHLTSGPTRQCTGGRRWPEAAIGVWPTPHGRLRLSFGGNVVLILQKAVVNVPIIVDGGNRPLELYKGPPHTLSMHHHSSLHSLVGEVVVGLLLYH